MKYLTLAVVATAPVVFGQTALAQTSAPDPVVATVNGSTILKSDVEAARTQLPEQYRKLPMSQLFEPLVSQLVRTKILAGKARADKLHETDGHKRRLTLFEDRMLEQTLLGQEVEKQITDKLLRERYKQAIAKFPEKEEVRARHILVKTEDEAKAIIKELEGGANFAKLASEKSTGPSKTRGGDLDYFGRGQMVPAFENAAFALKKGEITKKPVFSQFGWHVIKVEDKRQSKPPTFEESRAQLNEQMSKEIATEVVKKLTESADVQRFGLDGMAPRLKRVAPGK
jgi:peptidyl-prolyl cis-trans isomerase C